MITVVDCGIGNIGSILNMLRKLGVEARAVSDPQTISESTKLILPGVGAFDAGVAALERSETGPAIVEAVSQGAALLGICLGMQLLTSGSTEGQRPGLGLIAGHCERFDPQAEGLRVPHMGWNTVNPSAHARLFRQDADELRYYFVHSYHVVCDDPDDIAGTTLYGRPFTCALQRGSIYGTQFHPEKSHRFGMDLLGRFAEV